MVHEAKGVGATWDVFYDLPTSLSWRLRLNAGTSNCGADRADNCPTRWQIQDFKPGGHTESWHTANSARNYRHIQPQKKKPPKKKISDHYT